jgi:inositol hexakisphosphate/diphosphoinositol-pentakisphosphate kinase
MFSYIKSAFTKPKKSKDGPVEIKKIRLGICAMDKKAQSKPMREILKRFPPEYFEIVYYGDDMIKNRPIEEWPAVEVLIAFYSSHFPTEKAIEYVKLTKPFMINDLEMEAVLKDRRKVYQMFMSQGIDVPVHVFCNRDGGEDTNVIEEFDEVIQAFNFSCGVVFLMCRVYSTWSLTECI